MSKAKKTRHFIVEDAAGISCYDTSEKDVLTHASQLSTGEPGKVFIIYELVPIKSIISKHSVLIEKVK